jgi:hypothetical protein
MLNMKKKFKKFMFFWKDFHVKYHKPEIKSIDQKHKTFSSVNEKDILKLKFRV